MSTTPEPVAKTNTLALVGFILSMASFVVGITVIPGIILGHMGLSQIKKTGEQGRGLAIAALAVGYAVIGLCVIGMIIMVIFGIFFMNYHGGMMYDNGINS